MKHRGAPLNLIKQQIMKDFTDWCDKRQTQRSATNMIEFLYQQGFIQGKAFLDYCDNVPVPRFAFLEPVEPLREGFIPPRAWIGARK